MSKRHIGYRLPPVEGFLNSAINLIFYYRLIIVLALIVTTIWVSAVVYNSSLLGEQLKNCALVITGGSIVVGIFYSIINYEHNKQKFNHDIKSAKDILTFNTACKMHDHQMIGNFKKLSNFQEKNRTLYNSRNLEEIDNLLQNSEDEKIAFISVMNYFECISVGVLHGIMDEVFMRNFVQTPMLKMYRENKDYIDFLNKKWQSNRIYNSFTTLCEKWSKPDA